MSNMEIPERELC